MYKSSASKLRISARKARLVVDMIRGKGVNQALGILENTNKKAAPLVQKVLKSAIANAENQNPKGFDIDQLKVTQIYVDEGQNLKRHRPRAFGRGVVIRKRSSRVTLFVG